MCFRSFKQLLGCRQRLSDKHNGVEVQAYCAMIVCLLILIYTGEKPNRAMEKMVWYFLIGLASTRGSMLHSRGTNSASGRGRSKSREAPSHARR